MDSEVWRWVPGYEGLYLVSNKGRIFSTPKKTKPGRIMKQKTTKYGYKSICLCRDGETSDHRVHRLVASAFVKKTVNRNEVNHINGNRADNRAENLEWVTRSENEKHAYRVLGKKPTSFWSGKPRRFARRFSDEQVKEIRNSEYSSRLLASQFGVSNTTIKNIRNRKIYKEVC